MATQNNVHVPEDLLISAQRMAEAQGRTADGLAADALKRYLAHEWLMKLEREGAAHRERLGLISDEAVERYVEQMIAESRRERRDR